ncbi:hypothetical protein SAMN04487965_2420 [Microbulbifer donghaiensis]|uniref:Uncharacterized protein n=1 Tax=Microbulbifer donghaiensis TaxID=494016 RepID=A0A1M5D6E3_9GAMM|nr:hypothetical protein [Microbulbifer donghaiensis]SHF62546.1 hypothetical protein SAMN04487965_2420 [Microbulbifer donghaiensis]
MRAGFLCFAMLVIMQAMTNVAYGKGVTVELSITGPGLKAPVHTSDAEAIGANVWRGNFADWDSGVIEEPPAGLARYVVYFWVQVPRSTVQLKYALGYVWDPDTQRAVVYLPGPRDEWYRTNVSSILREGQDGHWFYASEPWGESVKRALNIQ